MNQPTLQERQRQLREEAILDAALGLLMEQGYAAMSMDDLAQRVGVSKATLYQHFTSKEELAVNVIVRSIRQGHDEMQAMDQTLPAIKRLELGLRHGLERRAKAWASGLNVPINLIKDPRYCAQHHEFVAYQEALIEQAKTEGDIDPSLPTGVIVRMIGGLFRADYEELLVDGATTKQQLSDALVAILFDGIRSKHAGVEQTPATRS